MDIGTRTGIKNMPRARTGTRSGTGAGTRIETYITLGICIKRNLLLRMGILPEQELELQVLLLFHIICLYLTTR